MWTTYSSYHQHNNIFPNGHVWENTFFLYIYAWHINASPSLNLMVYVHGIFPYFQFQLIIHNIMLGMSSQACSYQIFMLPISSTFIDLNDYYSEDVSLPMSFDVNGCGSFLPLVLRMSTLEGVLSNLNKVQSFFLNILFGARCSRPILKIFLAWASRRLFAWVACIVCKNFVCSGSCNEFFGVVNAFIFQW